ncbi:MATE family efflux transporter [Uliginosibacterium sp. 31-16]|uniref:MATE family efflux transporter n=1 Tax=Uliginosibacterium sp. 31-16 TaxID=3068315 RepID=UPI00273F0CED|nr:MATE family efflux transporter [Uliginosibacterium sp. 31-16]MDP5239878.1 MATE family efflux transporter [Uliginosibacterium sp. 31-16]
MSANKLRLFAITWPIFVENLLMVLMGLFGLWLTSRISTGAVAAYGLVNQILGALQILFRVVSIGTSVVVTQHHGANDEAGAHQVAKAGLAASSWVGLATLALLALDSNWILAAMHLPAELMPLGMPYMQALGVALLFDAVSMTMIATLRAYTFTRESMKIVLVMNLVQVALSVPLMLGVGDWPGWGLNGLAVAMALSRMLAIALAWRVWSRKLDIHIHLPDWLRLRWRPLSSILHIGLPGAGEKVAFRVSFIISVAMVASMGKAALATHAYVFQAVQLVTLFTNSVGFGTEIVVGHHVGAGQLHRSNRVLWQAMAWGMAIMVTCTLASYIFTPLAVARATSDAEILRLVGLIVLVELVLEPGRAFNIVVTSGLRAAGDARFPVKVSAVSVFLFGVGLGWLLGVYMGWGLVGIWIGYAADECCRGLAMAARWVSLGWVPYARRTRKRILAHMQAG